MEVFMALMPDTLEGWILAATALIGLFKAIAWVTPSKSDDKILDALLEIVHVLSLNVRQDKARPVKTTNKAKTIKNPMGGD